ncbi:hypothetical protein [Methanobacterium lacus]|nr:hypothetical protein [Methanobacterium lacus]
MEISAIFVLIMSILVLIFSILVINHYRLHPEKDGTILSISLVTLGIILVIGAITDLTSLLILLYLIIFLLYYKYTLNKNPEIRKNREKGKEILKKHPTYKILRISQYIMLACAIFLSLIISIIVIFNIKF